MSSIEQAPQGQVEEIKIEIPRGDALDEAWLTDFTQRYGGERFEITLQTETWLVQPPDEIASGYYQVEDRLGPKGWRQTIKGTIWNAAITDTPKIFESSRGPVVSLLNARFVKGDNSEEPIIDATQDRYVPPEVRIPPEERMVLVRLDRLAKDQPVIVEPIDAQESDTEEQETV